MLYRALVDFEKQLKARHFFEYKDRSIVFGKQATQWSQVWIDQIKISELKDDFKVITATRHWLFHHTSAEPPVCPEDALAAMGRVLSALQGVGDPARSPPTDWKDTKGSSQWCSRHQFDRSLFVGDTVTVNLDLTLSAPRMSIPIPPTRCFNGRKSEVSRKL